MAHNTLILADGKGFTRPRVVGDEYVVDAVIEVTSYTESGESITASELGLSTITAVMVVGALNPATVAIAGVDFTDATNMGNYASSSSFLLRLFTEDGTSKLLTELTGSSTDADDAPVRVRVYGLI